MFSASIVLAHHDFLFRLGLRSLLEDNPNWKVIGEASTGKDAIAESLRLRPQITIVDIRLPQLDGLEATRQIIKALRLSRILLLSDDYCHETVQAARDAGARGYVVKRDYESQIVTAVQRILHGGVSFTFPAKPVLLNSGHGASRITQPALTTRETEIVQLLADGKTNKEAANVLNISSRTVEGHRAQIMDKLGLCSFSELIRYAIRNRVIDRNPARIERLPTYDPHDMPGVGLSHSL